MRHITIAGALAFLLGSAHADTYTYDCKVRGKLYTLKVDDESNELSWRGKTYRIRVQENCAKYGWKAQRPGETFDFCTSTKGYADFRQNGALVRCDQKVTLIPEEFHGKWVQVPIKDEKCNPANNPIDVAASRIETNGGETSCELSDAKEIKSPTGSRLELSCFQSGEGDNGTERHEVWRLAELFGKRVFVKQVDGELSFWQRCP